MWAIIFIFIDYLSIISYKEIVDLGIHIFRDRLHMCICKVQLSNDSDSSI